MNSGFLHPVQSLLRANLHTLTRTRLRSQRSINPCGTIRFSIRYLLCLKQPHAARTTKSCEISNVTANQKTCNGAWGYHDGRALQAWKNQTGRAPGPNKRCKALGAPWTLQVPKQLMVHQAHCTRHVLP